ncbi:MICOS complex subunit MIC60 [Parasteatoda tepidariorum]|uniref:MICOS complex subunit MIC60 n=1 Tax=Parasteatoda tepidariorum TaxID=114398 RepID=UPI001C729A08|nr:MICOS complex subunit MIC60 [Parasteatoda tepidariorum]
MWRSLKQAAVKSKIHNKVFFRNHSNELYSKSRKVAIVTAAACTGLVSAVVYSKYDSALKSVFERYIPYINKIYELLPDFYESKSLTPETSLENKELSNFLKDEPEDAAGSSQKFGVDFKTHVKDGTVNSDVNKLEVEPVELNVSLSEKQASKFVFNESFVNGMVKQLESSCSETILAYEDAVEEIRKYMKSLCAALSGDPDSNIAWKQAYQATCDRNAAIERAEEKASNTKALIEKLKSIAKNVALEDPKHPLINMCDDTVKKIVKELNNSETKIKSVENEIKSTSEYQMLVNKCIEEFRQKFQNWTHGLSDKKTIDESDLNALIVEAHQKIEQLQKQLAKQQVTEEVRLGEAVRKQILNENSLIEDKIGAELEKRNIEIEIAVLKRVSSLKENFESELRKLLHIQAAAHSDHIQKLLKVHEQEIERKYSLDLEERLLHTKGAIASDMSGLMARLKKILAFLKAKTDLDAESRKAESLWLSCQSMSNKISSNNSNLNPLEEDIASIKLSADESNVYVNTVLAGIPNEALSRGVCSPGILKQKFFDVKKVCRKVAMIDENNDSLYRYFLSYLQSCLIIDEVSIPAAELEGKVAVDPREWDTYDILSRISYSLQSDNLEQALRYANQLKGEARIVANEWIKELRLLLETQTVVKALSAYAAAVNVQAYH